VALSVARAAASAPSVFDIRRFRAFSWGLLVYTTLVAVWGAYVRASGSGAGCGSHWPLCNGEIVPRAPQVETLVEFGHRATSGLSILAVAALCIWSFRLFPRGDRVRKLSVVALLLLFVEALLGAGLVLFSYVEQNASVGRAFYLAAHLVNTLLLLGALSLTAWSAERSQISLRIKNIPWTFWAALAAAVLVSVTGAIAALGDTLFPATSISSGVRQDFSTAASFLVRLRVLHPVVAVCSGLLFFMVAAFALRANPNRATRRLSHVVIFATAAQICAGLINLLLLAPIWMQVVHLLLAYTVWVALVLFVAEDAISFDIHSTTARTSRTRD
jgi:cytochrome c oxidase assembly protein subunit 15